MTLRLVALLALAACSGPVARPAGAPAPAPAPGSAAAVPIDAPGPSEEERLAAIQKAMNELDEAAQQCWAVAATERFDVEGEVEVLVDIAATSAQAQVRRDTTRNPRLVGCLRELLARYRWAPPLHGQAIQLPFKFRAPDGQNTIDRALVAWNGQGKVSVAVLLDENNSGNGAASMFEVAVAAGGATGLRLAERTELWYFLGAGAVDGKPVAAGDMMLVPAGAARELAATAGDVHAVLVMVPGGREGTARAGALPTRQLGAAKAPGPLLLPAANAKRFGPATLIAEPATTKQAAIYGGVIELPAGATVPAHVHAKETELLYILAGAGTMTVNGVQLAVTPSTVVQIPPNTKHAFTATAAVRAVQFYTPAGPEQRFKTSP